MSFLRNLFDNCVSIFLKNIPSKSYTFEFDEILGQHQIRLKDGNDYSNCHKYSEYLEAFMVESSSKNEIACLMIKPNAKSRFTILFNHGGNIDLGKICNFLFTLSKRLECNIFIYDYSGFGQSSGRPTEQAIYEDAETALSLLQNRYKISLDQIIIYGQSLGTAPTLYLATKNPNIKAIILHSPFLSMGKLFLPKRNGPCQPYDIFKNIEMVENIEVPTLIMHGTNDRTVPIKHAQELYQKCRNSLKPLWVEQGGHNDLYTFDSYLKRLKRLVYEELNIMKLTKRKGFNNTNIIRSQFEI
ncbi:hypothetical protein NH340_JMT01748 [Sarcoptes scabiei]|nr:hypothetical protein NH340_JMT01748 [Sarcoptes scabiei]